jgi:lipoate-protein ligase A
MPFEDFIRPLDLIFEKIEIAQFGIPLEHCNLIHPTNGSFAAILDQKPSVLLLPYCAKPTGCDLRNRKSCRVCGEDGCTIGTAWQIGRQRRMRVAAIVSFEDLWEELMRMRTAGEPAYIGCCCQPFFAKHADDFRRSGVPGILLDIDNTTCYELGQAQHAYAGQFENQTALNLGLLQSVLNVLGPV